MRLLVNAEPFGFGPSAAAAQFASRLRRHVDVLGYAGEGHTLELQDHAGYDCIRRMDGAGREEWNAVLQDYDALLTATDVGTAEIALQAGLRVAFYDPLSWYWQELPRMAALHPVRCLYIAQDFIGVRERLLREAPHAVVVPPIVERQGPRSPEDMMLLCLGGLHNPMWPPAEADLYATAVISAVRHKLPAGISIQVAASSSVARACNAHDVKVRDSAEMASLMSRACFALMTPGLGNIYDAASWDLPVAWLPPANGSQAQQLELLAREGMAGIRVAWDARVGSMHAYGSQASFMTAVRDATAALGTPQGASELDASIDQAISGLVDGGIQGAGELLVRYGSGGADMVASQVASWLSIKGSHV